MTNKNRPFHSHKLFQIPLILLFIALMYMPKVYSAEIVANHCWGDFSHDVEFDVADTICADGTLTLWDWLQFIGDAYIIPNTIWSGGETLTDILSENRITSGIQGGGFWGFPIGQPGMTPRGEYDLILDANVNGVFDAADDIIGSGAEYAFRVVESGRPIPDVSAIKARAAGLETTYAASARAWPLYLDLLDAQSQASAFASGPLGIMEYYLWKPYNDMTGDFARKIMGGYGTNPSPPPQRLATGILGNAAKKWGDLARDPADPVFDEFVALDLQGIATETVGFSDPYVYPFEPLGSSQREADMVAWGNLGVQQVALVQALQFTIEKYQGADQAYNDIYAYLQIRQLKEYANMLKANMTGSILLANQIKANIIAEGDDDVLDVSALASFQQRVINSGLTPEEEGNILALGFDAADITEAELRIEGWDLPASDGKISERLDDLVTDLTAAVTTMQDLATTSQSLMDYLTPSITIVHPTADAGGPYSGDEGSLIAFSGAGSSDPTLQVLTYEWDFNNNGVFGEVPDDRTGSAVTYQWDYEYTGVVGLKVTDPDGNYDIDYADVTTLTANSEPVINSLIPVNISPTASVYAPLDFSVTATDPDSDPLTYSWLLDGVAQSANQNWTYTPQATDSGYKVVTAKVSDGSSLSRDVFETRKVMVYSDADSDGFTSDTDCDDSDAAINPNAVEVCDDTDNDCDGLVDETVSTTYYADLDGDGFGDPNNTVQGCATPPAGSVADSSDCNDSDGTTYPGAVEVCDGIDNDCDGTIDDGLTVDLDGDGHSTPASCEGTQDDCDDGDAAIYPGAPEICDGIDNDCDGTVDEGVTDDLDGDGFTVCDGDCDDSDNTRFPGNPEVCDGKNNDCDSIIPVNEIDNDGDGYSSCGGDCNDGNAAVNPGTAEICDSVDNDCDGFVDEGFDLDFDGFTTCGGDCDDSDDTINPNAIEVCDGVDNDCDGTADDGLTFDLDGDGYSTPASCEGTQDDCDDNNPNINPGVTEIGENGIDDDCNAATHDVLVNTFIIATDDNARAYYARSNGDGTWSNYRQVVDLPGNAVRGAAIADYDNDGDFDFLIPAHPSGNTLNLYLFTNDGADNFANDGIVATSAVSSGGAYGMTTTDFNNDGHMDFTISRNGSYVVVGLGDGQGGFSVSEFNTGLGNGRGMDYADFDHDGNMDFVRSRYSSGQIHLWRGDGTGSFVNAGLVGDPGTDPYGVTAGDFDNDSHDDVIANYGGNGNAYFYKGNGDGTFNAGIYVGSIDFNNHGAYDNYDFNGDGNQDIIATSYTSRVIRFYPGNGNGTFGAAVRVNPSNTPGNILGVSAPVYHALGTPYAVVRPAELSIPLGNVANLDGSDSNDSDNGGSIVSWDWDFGDGATGTGAIVSHTYAAEGPYNVKLKVIDNDGRISFGSGIVKILGSLPVADAGGPYTFGESFADDAIYTVSLDGSGSTDDSNIVKYEWDYSFKDSFTGTVLSAARWLNRGTSQNEVASIIGAGSWSNRYIFSKENFTRKTDLEFQAKVRPVNTSGNQHFMIGFKDTGTSYSHSQMPHAIYFNNNNIHVYENGSNRGTFGSYSRGDEYEIKIALKTQGAKYYYRPTDNTAWATGATASSQYSTGSWSAARATGAPNVTSCTDNANAWTTASSEMGEQWIELTYASPIVASKIRVHETYNTGFITRIDLYDASDVPTTVWNGTDSTSCPGWFEADVNPVFSTQKVRIYIDSNVPGWNEIDAVGLVTADALPWTLLYDSNYSNTSSMKVGGTLHSGTIELDDLQVSPLIQVGVNPVRILNKGTQTVTLTVTDTVGQQDSETTTINTVFNNPPTANAGGSYSVDESAASEGGWPVTLDGSGSSDDVEINRHIWNFGVDTFDGTALETGKWYTNGGISRNDMISLSGSNTWNTRYMVSKDTFPKRKGLTFQAKVMVTGGGQCMLGFKNSNTSNFHYNQFPYEFYLYHGNVYIYENSSSRGDTGFNFSYNTWYDYKIELKDAGAIYSYRQSGNTNWIVVYVSSYTTGDTDLRKGIVVYDNTWNIDDFVQTTAGVNPTHRFYGAGSHSVDLTVYDRVNQSHTDSTTVQANVSNFPVADSGADIAKDETGAVNGTWTVNFNASGSTDDHGIYTYEWDWNYDGTTFNPSGDTGATPSHTFTAIGTYTVAVRVTDHALQAHIDILEVTITQGDPPTADTGGPYSVDEFSGNASEGGWTVSFDGSGSSDIETSIAKYLWDMGTDTFEGTVLNESKWFYSGGVTQNGEVSVATPTDGWGRNYFFSKDTYSRAKGMAFETKVRHNSSVMVGLKNTNNTLHYNQMTYAIYFAGTNIYIYENGSSRGDTGKDAPYNTWYDVRIELKENSGALYYYRVSGTQDWILLYNSNHSNAASFKRGADVHSGTLLIDDMKEVAAGATPSYRFYGLGNHPVNLTVWDQAYQTHSASTTVVTLNNEPPVVDAGADRTGNEIDAFEGAIEFDFDATNSTDDHGIFTYEWDWDYDGTTFVPSGDTASTLSHTFVGVGSSTVALRVTDHALQSTIDTATVTLIGGAPPVAVAGDDITTEGHWPVVFNGANSSDDIQIGKYAWDFGDGTTGTGRTPTHIYWTPGDYTVTLTVYDNILQSASDTLVVHVITGNAPVADAGGPYDAGAGNPPAYFNGSSSTDDYGVVKYLWDVNDSVDSNGDGNLTNDMDVVGRKPIYTYSAAGSYTATLTVVDGAGQTGTDTATVNVAANLAPNVICVPWVATDPLSRHETYSGRSIRLKGIVRDAGNLTYQWDFGDGTAPYPATPAAVSDKYEIEASHVYNGGDGALFTATLSVWDSSGLKGTDQYHIIVQPDNYDTRTNIAIDEGLWYVHKSQNRSNGSWNYGGYIAPTTGSAIQAFEINGHLQDGDNQENPYVETVKKGFEQLFTRAGSVNINYAPYMTHGNPDTNNNGVGLQTTGGHPIYQGGMVMDAIASSNTPLAFATTGGTNVKGRFYYEILTDMADMYNYGQVESGWARGGWRYGWHSSADNSACQWAAIGLTAAEDNFGINVPQFVKDENDIWLNYSFNGNGFGYSAPNTSHATAGTPSGMVQLTFDDIYTSDPRWRAAEDYIATHWSTWSGTYYYATYALVKSLRLAQPEPVVTFKATGFDWYNDPVNGIRKKLVDAQRSNGGWYGSGFATNYNLHTPWVIIMLTPTLFVQPPVADAGDDIIWAYGEELTFNASGTFHKDPLRSIVKYEWDFDADGTWDLVTDDPSDPNAKFTYPDPNPEQSGDPVQVFEVRLRVTDNNNPEQTDIDIRKVTVAEPPHAPFAVTGGAYTATAGIPFTLDASGSFDIDPGDSITSYQWDLDNDGVFFDDIDINTTNATETYTYQNNGVYIIGLKVMDNGGFNPVGCTIGVDCIPMESLQSFTTVTVVSNEPPVADAGGPYVVDEGTQITFDGSASSDPNGDILTYAWDFDNDGVYDDATGVQPSFTFPDNGTYTIGLQVSDSLLTDTATATVTVNDLSPAAAFTWSPQPQNEGSSVSFTDQSVSSPDTITSWSWDFDGLGSSNVQNPGFAFPENGSYSVSLTVTDSDGSFNTVAQTVTIVNVPPSVNAGPDQTETEDETVNFAGSFTDPGTLDTHTIEWDFGDGNSATGSLTPSHIFADPGTYTVTLTVTDDDGGIGSDTLEMTVELGNEPPVASCQNITVALDNNGLATIVPGDINNGSSDPDGDPLTLSLDIDSFNCSNVGIINTVTLTVSDSILTDTCTATITVMDNVLPVINCPADVTVNTDFGSSSAVYSFNDPTTADNCSVDSLVQDAGLFSGSTFPIGVTTNTFSATDSSSNTASCSFTVTVIDSEDPVVTCPADQTVCTDAGLSTRVVNFQYPTATDNSDGAVTVVQTAGLVSGDAFPIGDTTNTYLATDPSGNTSSCSFTVTVVDCEPPVVTCPLVDPNCNAPGLANAVISFLDPVATDNSGGAVILTQTGGLFSGSSFPLGDTTNTYLATDSAGNISNCSFTVTVDDCEPPTISCPDNVVVSNDAGSCDAVVNYVLPTGSDNSGSVTISQTVGLPVGSVFPLGTSTVTYQAADPTGNTAECSFTVTVNDDELPVAVAKDIIVQLDAAGNTSITASDVDNGSSDNCGIASLSVAPASFNCVNVGANTVTLTVTDNNGNINTATATVTVEDNVAPVALAQDITAQLDAAGNVSIIAGQIDNGSNDACGIASLSVTPSSFDCSNVGANTVTLTVIDNNGNTSTATATVTVVDTVAPTAVAQSITVQLDATGSASITAAQIDNGSSDNCGIASLSVAPSSFNCANVGSNTVTLTVTDNNGNTNTATVTVTVEDNVAPNALASDITVQLDANGNVSITAGQVDNGSNDACGIASLSVVPSVFNCANVGANTVALTVTDNNGNASTATAVITVQDSVPPVVLTQNITVQLDANGNASILADGSGVNNGSSDNCGIASTSVVPNIFGCSDVGANIVTLTVADVNGNVNTGSAVVTVVDAVMPIALAQDITAQLDATGNVSIATGDVDAGSSDNCGINSLSLSQTDFNCDNVGENTVTLTVTDNNGNVSTATAVVTVEDNVEPVASAQDITVELGENGDVTITAEQVDNVSSDACGIESLSVSPETFDCSHVGENTVTLTVTDVNGNVSTTTAVVTVENNLVPVVLTQLLTIQLDEEGNAMIQADGSEIDAGSSDTCGIDFMTAEPTAFTCSNIGDNTVTLTVTNVNGNSNSAPATVTVEDSVLPEIEIPVDVTVECTGDTSSAATGVATGTDTCGTVTITESDSSVPGVGNTEVITRTWTATDESGNSVSGDQIITVVDTTFPELEVPIDATVECTGDTSSTVTGVASGTDTCGNVTITESDTSVAGPGNTEVITRTWTVTDESGNSVSGDQIITVVDTTVPELTAPADATVECTEDTSSAATGVATGSDTCGTVTITESDVSVAGPGDTEVITRTWTAIDDNGNSASGDQIITVVDTTSPVLTVPAAATVECTEDTSSAATGVATGTDTCGSVTISESDTSVPGCGNTSVISRTWKATDENGNVATGVQTITVEDTTSPVVTAELVPVKLRKKHGCFRVEFSATDSCGDVPTLTASLNGHPVTNGELVKLHYKKQKKHKKHHGSDDDSSGSRCRIKIDDGDSKSRDHDSGSGHRHGSSDDKSSAYCGTVKFECHEFVLTVTATDECGNEGTGTATHVFEDGSHDGSSDGGSDDNGCCDGKVTELTLKYIGSDSALIVVKQKHGSTVFSGTRAPGDTFSFVGTDKKGTLGTEISIFVDGNLDTQIHTSCSKPIGPGLVKGDFEVVSGRSRNGGDLCPVIDNSGDDDGSSGSGHHKKKCKKCKKWNCKGHDDDSNSGHYKKDMKKSGHGSDDDSGSGHKKKKRSKKKKQWWKR